MLFAEVIVPRHIAKSFTYRIPSSMLEVIAVGQRVFVPFGRVELEGVVISLNHHLPFGIPATSIKEIRAMVTNAEGQLPPGLFELSHKIADYYVSPWGQCLRLVCSPLLKSRPSLTRYTITEQGRLALSADHCPDDLRPILERIARRSRGVLSSTIQSTRSGKRAGLVDTLIKNSWVSAAPGLNADRDSNPPSRTLLLDDSERGISPDRISVSVELPDSDSSWNALVAEYLHAQSIKKLVLHAGWQHRLRRLADAVQQAYGINRSTIVVSGEAAKAVWLSQTIATLTGLPVTLADSTTRSDQYHRPVNQPSIVIGTRSAIFVPLHRIGLIWVDGEEDPALKELQEPRYHAREVALWRAESERALLVLASAHPSLESRFDEEADLHRVPEEAALRPKIDVVDLRNEPGGSLLSQKLIHAMYQALKAHAGIVLFLNRKGYANTLVCRDCGWVPRCTTCSVPLAYHREPVILACRYCAVMEPVPNCCPICQAIRLHPLGEGTERVEAEVRRLFPDAKTARLDGTTLRRPASSRTLWASARAGTWDVLIGTQALFQKEPLPPQQLIGILHADSGFHISDFRGAERAYHLMIDAAGLAKPADAGGQVIVQTKFPTHHAVQALLSGQPELFYHEELAARRLLNYPPSCHLANLWIIGKDLLNVEQAAKRWSTFLEHSDDRQEAVTVLGPVPAIGAQTRGYHRHRILVKATQRRTLSHRITDTVQKMERLYPKGQVKFVVDIDPVE
jgi:primosomal protein N' (replication factor Y) (superfamily II helicase)